MNDILEQYGGLILACLCGIIILGIAVSLFIGPFKVIFDGFLSRFF